MIYETHKKRRGRPKKSPEDLRRNRVNAKYTDDDFLLIKKIQEDHGFSYPADAVHWMTLQISPALENSFDVFQTHVNAERIRDGLPLMVQRRRRITTLQIAAHF